MKQKYVTNITAKTTKPTSGILEAVLIYNILLQKKKKTNPSVLIHICIYMV